MSRSQTLHAGMNLFLCVYLLSWFFSVILPPSFYSVIWLCGRRLAWPTC